MDSVDEILFTNREKIKKILIKRKSGKVFATKHRIPFDRLSAYKESLRSDLRLCNESEEAYTNYEEFQFETGKRVLNPQHYYDAKKIRFHDLNKTGKHITSKIKKLSKSLKQKQDEQEEKTEVKKQLTISEQLFVQHFLTTRNALKAAAMAGYQGSSAGHDLQNKPHVRDAIMLKLAEGFDNTGVTVESVLTSLKVIQDRAMQGHPVIDQDGVYLGEWKCDYNASLKATELLGKYLKMFSDRLEHTGPNGGPIKVVVEPKWDFSRFTVQQLEQFKYLCSLLVEVPQETVEAEYKKV